MAEQTRNSLPGSPITLTPADREFLSGCCIVMPEDEPRPVPQKSYQYHEAPAECTCFLGHPPCGWCENYDPDAEEGE